MRLSSRRGSGFTLLVLLALQAAAFVTPVIEVGDLLEATLDDPEPSSGPAQLKLRPSSGAPSRGSQEEFLVVGQYLAVGPRGLPRPALVPLARLLTPRTTPLSLGGSDRVALDRGPPAFA